ncbi:MAG: zinc ribbon domain-containing protein [Candidatus Rhabdochlamydia sp.]
MKKQLWVFFTTMLMTASVFGSSLEKMYLDVDQVLFDASGIYIEVDNCYYKVDAIALDKEKNRYYALKKETNWQCPNCGIYNYPEDKNCFYCGWPWGPP